MANFFYITLDTTGPSTPAITIEGSAVYTTSVLVDTWISTLDGDTTGYQMKIWGDVDTSENVNIQNTELLSSWITFSNSQQVKLSTGDGEKVTYLKIRDNVYNESSLTSDSIILDTTLPVVSIAGPDVDRISKITNKDTCSFTFTCDSEFDEYKVKVVNASGNAHDTGQILETANGSTNMSGTNGGYPASTPIACQIKGADLEATDAGDGSKIIKIFVKDVAGNWSV